MNPYVAKDYEFTRWRSLSKPISPLDPIQPDSPRYEEGKLPPNFVLLLWDGRTLSGPRVFADQTEADQYLKEHPDVLEFLIVPKPENNRPRIVVT